MTPAASEILAVVQRYAQAWAANDLKAIVDCYHDEVVFHYFGRSPLAGTHRGKAACLAVLKQVKERTNRRLAYTVTDGKATHHHASAQVFAHGEGRSRFVWITDVLPDGLAAYVEPMMAQGGAAMKKTLEKASER